MKLFNAKTLKRHIGEADAIPETALQMASDWVALITSGAIYNHTEVSLHADFKANIVEGLLGYVGPVGHETYTVAAEESVTGGSMDLALGHFTAESSQILAPFELKGANTKDLDAIMSGRAKTPVQQAWEYAVKIPGARWVLVSNYTEIRLYAFGQGLDAYERFDLAKLTDPYEFARFHLLLSAENLLGERTGELLIASRREDKDITDALYADYKAIRTTLINEIEAQAPAHDMVDIISAAQTILDRILFTAFAEDTGLLPRHILTQAYEHSDPFNPKPVWENFRGLFTAIDKGNQQLNVPPYNGGLFAPDEIADQIMLSDEVCEGFKKIGDYDFESEISVTILGRMFEKSISDIEVLQAKARGEEVKETKPKGTKGRTKRDGVVYTGDDVARIIGKLTMGPHLDEIFADVFSGFITKDSSVSQYDQIKWKRKTGELEAWEAYRDRLKSLRIVDPACGSGVFLVTAFDFMKAELTRVNDKIIDLKGGVADLFDPDSEILTNNLFGVDVNSESVEIAKLSLWVKTARQGKLLDSLDDNIKVGDSLIEDSNYAYLEHGFTWKKAFPHVFAEGGFDIVLGNPPYVRMELIKALKPYLETRYEVVSDRADLYCYFFERGLRLLKPGGRLGYISSSTFFKTGSGEPLRNYLREKAKLESVIDFGDLQIFEGVTTYPAILTMQNAVPAQGHSLHFWNVERLPEAKPYINFGAEFDDVKKTYSQSHLTNGSWELESPALKALRDKIRAGKPTLKEVYGAPFTALKPASIKPL